MDFFLKNNAYNISKAKLELDYYPQVDLVTGIKKTIERNKNVLLRTL
jgi:nucleoside-diphosphate-sugar epimerase